MTHQHECAQCPNCIHDGQKCCGCYDGACCIGQLATEPVARCVACGRATWDEASIGGGCHMSQPDGSRCVGTFEVDDTETPTDTRAAGVDTAEDRTEAHETDAGGMDNQGAELDRLRAQVAHLSSELEIQSRARIDATNRAEAAELDRDVNRAKLMAERAKVARVEALRARWASEAVERGHGDTLYTAGVVDMLGAALAGDA